MSVAWLEHRVPPPLVGLAIAAAMWPLAKLLPRVITLGGWHRAIALAVAATGLALAGAAVIEFRRAHTTVNPLRPARATVLVSGGVFRLSRNPMYAGLMLALLAWALWLASPLALAGPVAFVAYIDRFQIRPEERALAARFGADFENYRARVRRWL
ncbi:MAG: isoprenylcysteine carboxylmethyltransferase family protein [Burkholderiaceae bacterium]